MNPDDEWAREVMAGLQTKALEFTQRLVDSCLAGDGEAASYVAQELFQAQNPYLLMLTLGQLTIRSVKADRRAAEAHGPLLTPEDVGHHVDSREMPVWSVGVHDQMRAAVDHGDYRTFAITAVDGQLRAIGMDVAESGEVNWDSLVRGMMLIDQNTLTVIAAEALYRLAVAQMEGG